MKKKYLLFFLVCSQPFWLFSQTAREIVAKADAQSRGKSSYTEMTMTILRPSYQRSISMKGWSLADRYSLIKITAPAKDAGSGYLKRQKELWNWLPSIDKMIKMNASVMGQSWMGSDFTNDDMIRESSIVRDYTPTLLPNQTLRQTDCWVIELIPLPSAAVVWGKVVVWIEKDGYHTIRTECYDEEMVLSQTMENYDFKNFSGRLMPSRMEVVPALKKGQKTVVTIKKAQYDLPIEESFFSQQNLKKQL